MTTHTTSIVPVPQLALSRIELAHERSARVCHLALTDCPADIVARRVDRSADLVRRWGRGQGSPTLTQILASPERFALRLLALAGESVAPSTVIEVSPWERLRLAMSTLGALLAETPRDVDELTKLTPEQLREADRRWAALEQQARDARKSIARALDDKGGR